MTKFLTTTAIAAVALLGTAANAADFSFAGNLPTADDVAFFDFSVTSTSTVTLRTYSWAGGTNAAGNTISAGGFDPILALYDLSTGLLIGQNDDGGCGNVGQDSGVCYDTFFQSILTAGNYRVGVSVFPNFGGSVLATSYTTTGYSFGGRTSAFAFDALNVNTATGPGAAVPEPATWALMILGFGLVGGALRSRRSGTLARA